MSGDGTKSASARCGRSTCTCSTAHRRRRRRRAAYSRRCTQRRRGRQRLRRAVRGGKATGSLATHAARAATRWAARGPKCRWTRANTCAAAGTARASVRAQLRRRASCIHPLLAQILTVKFDRFVLATRIVITEHANPASATMCVRSRRSARRRLETLWEGPTTRRAAARRRRRRTVGGEARVFRLYTRTDIAAWEYVDAVRLAGVDGQRHCAAAVAGAAATVAVAARGLGALVRRRRRARIRIPPAMPPPAALTPAVTPRSRRRRRQRRPRRRPRGRPFDAAASTRRGRRRRRRCRRFAGDACRPPASEPARAWAETVARGEFEGGAHEPARATRRRLRGSRSAPGVRPERLRVVGDGDDDRGAYLEARRGQRRRRRGRAPSADHAVQRPSICPTCAPPSRSSSRQLGCDP